MAERLSALDAILWREGVDPYLLPVVTNVVWLARVPERDSFNEIMNTAINALPRLKSVIRLPRAGFGLPRWDEVSGFSLQEHISWSKCPGDGTMQMVIDLAAQMSTQPFPPSRPPWFIRVVNGLCDGGAALIIVRHHAIIDGTGFFRIIQKITKPAFSKRSVIDIDTNNYPKLNPNTASVARWPDKVKQLAVNLVRTAHALRPRTRRLSSVMQGVSLNREFRNLTWPETDFKSAATLTNASFNDIFLAGVALAMRRYHILHNAGDEEIRLSLPVNMRDTGSAGIGGNRFVMITAKLSFANSGDAPCALRNCQRIVRTERSWIPAGFGAEIGIEILARLPSVFTAAVYSGVLKGVDVATTNMLCSRMPLMFADNIEIVHFASFISLCGAAANLAFIRYAGRISIGINLDPAAISDTEVFVGCLRDGINEALAQSM